MKSSDTLTTAMTVQNVYSSPLCTAPTTWTYYMMCDSIKNSYRKWLSRWLWWMSTARLCARHQRHGRIIWCGIVHDYSAEQCLQLIFVHNQNHRSLLQNIVSFIGLLYNMSTALKNGYGSPLCTDNSATVIFYSDFTKSIQSSRHSQKSANLLIHAAADDRRSVRKKIVFWECLLD